MEKIDGKNLSLEKIVNDLALIVNSIPKLEYFPVFWRSGSSPAPIHSFPQVLAVSTKRLSTRGLKKRAFAAVVWNRWKYRIAFVSTVFVSSGSFSFLFFAGITSERAKSGSLLGDPRGSEEGSSNREEGESLELRTKNKRGGGEEGAVRGEKRGEEKNIKKNKIKVKRFRWRYRITTLSPSYLKLPGVARRFLRPCSMAGGEREGRSDGGSRERQGRTCDRSTAIPRRRMSLEGCHYAQS